MFHPFTANLLSRNFLEVSTLGRLDWVRKLEECLLQVWAGGAAVAVLPGGARTDAVGGGDHPALRGPLLRLAAGGRRPLLHRPPRTPGQGKILLSSVRLIGHYFAQWPLKWVCGVDSAQVYCVFLAGLTLTLLWWMVGFARIFSGAINQVNLVLHSATQYIRLVLLYYYIYSYSYHCLPCNFTAELCTNMASMLNYHPYSSISHGNSILSRDCTDR